MADDPTEPDDADDIAARTALVDHHCHALIVDELDPARFESLLGESGRAAPPGCSAWDTNLGLAVRAWCAPVLDLPAAAPPAAYLRRRAELGGDEVATRMLAGGARRLLVDTGYRGDELVGLDRMAGWAQGPVDEITRLETLAETVAAAGIAADGYADAFADAVRASGCVGWKSVAAYRGGLDLDWRRPTPSEVREAAAEWLGAGPAVRPGGPARWRLEHPVLVRHGVWSALDTGRPVQFHTGFGDTDAKLRTSDPALLTDLIEASAELDTAIVLLHCWPRHREAAYLAGMWPHVYLDVGEAIPHTGHRAPAILAEALELAPWHKVLYASDAFGLAEIYHLGVTLHRLALAASLRSLGRAGFDTAELTRLADLVGHANAARIYALT